MKTKKYLGNDFARPRRAPWIVAVLLLAAALASPVWAVTVGVVNINTASAAELELLPGVGAQRPFSPLGKSAGGSSGRKISPRSKESAR